MLSGGEHVGHHLPKHLQNASRRSPTWSRLKATTSASSSGLLGQRGELAPETNKTPPETPPAASPAIKRKRCEQSLGAHWEAALPATLPRALGGRLSGERSHMSHTSHTRPEEGLLQRRAVWLPTGTSLRPPKAANRGAEGSIKNQKGGTREGESRGGSTAVRGKRRGVCS